MLYYKVTEHSHVKKSQGAHYLKTDTVDKGKLSKNSIMQFMRQSTAVWLQDFRFQREGRRWSLRFLFTTQLKT